MSLAPVSLGVAGALGADVIAQIASAAEGAGVHALWVNDTPGGDSLAALAAAAEVTDRLQLATGVIPMDRFSVDDIVFSAAELPQERVTLGIGSGQRPGPVLAPMREAAEQLRERTAARVVVGALGPKMRRLAARSSDGVLLNWLTPDAAADQRAQARAERADAQVALYVRTALTGSAVARLRAEAERYAGFPAYAANFQRLGMDVRDTVLEPATAEAELPAYRDAVDEVVLRVMTRDDDLADYLDAIERIGTLIA